MVSLELDSRVAAILPVSIDVGHSQTPLAPAKDVRQTAGPKRAVRIGRASTEGVLAHPAVSDFADDPMRSA